MNKIQPAQQSEDDCAEIIGDRNEQLKIAAGDMCGGCGC